MAKKKLPRKAKDKIPAQKTTFKGELLNDEELENYELSEEFYQNNPLKTPPNKFTAKNKETEEKG